MPDTIDLAHSEQQQAQAAFRDALIRHGLLIPTGVDGVYGRSAVFEDILFDDDLMVRRRL